MVNNGSTIGNQIVASLMQQATTVAPDFDEGSEDDPEFIVEISNFDLVQEGKKTVRVGKLAPQILTELLTEADGFPKSCGGKLLFAVGPDQKIKWLEDHDKLLAFIDGFAKANWAQGSDKVTPKRFFIHACENCEQFESVEEYPHFPAIDGYYYVVPEPNPQLTGRLDEFVDMFCPETWHDRELIKALVLTVVWGGPAGARPIFIITGPDNDPKGGRGVGKSHLVRAVASLVGGIIAVSPDDSVERIKTRLLSAEGRPVRVALIDNLKTFRFSWAALEGLVTAPVVSGHALYKGEGRRPNHLIWCITVNGVSVSKDIAQRGVVIKLARPAHFSSNWSADLNAFIENHRWDILSDAKFIIENQE